MRKTIFVGVVLMLMSMGTAVQAEGLTKLHLQQFSGTEYNEFLTNVQHLNFADKSVVYVELISGIHADIPANDLRKITFSVQEDGAVTGLESVGNDTWRIYAKNQCIVTESDAAIHSLRIVNLSGQTILHKNYTSERYSVVVEASSLSAGIYIVSAETAEGRICGKVSLR